jgi:hypothetical protein
MTAGSGLTPPQPRRRTWASVGGWWACEAAGADLTTERYATTAEQVRPGDELHIVGRAPFSLLDLAPTVALVSHAMPPRVADA